MGEKTHAQILRERSVYALARVNHYEVPSLDALRDVADACRAEREHADRVQAELLAALDAYHRWMTAHYDDLAEEFYRATGLMAPGKDEPQGYGTGTYEEKRTAWDAWLKERKAALADQAFAAIAKARGEK